ncbi:MAG: LCP family protein [bacterium]
MSDHYNKQNFFLDEDDLRDYEEYKKSHGAAERSREKLPYIKDGEEDPVRVSSRKKAAGSGRAAGPGQAPRPREGRRPAAAEGPGRARPAAKPVPAKRRRRRSHPVRNFLLVLILVLALGIGAGAAVFLPSGKNISPSFNPGADVSMSQRAWTTIALFGVDSREQNLGEGNNRSDAILICAVHKLTGKIRLVSLYRDTFLDVGDGTYTKANAAYAYGGPQQAVTMLNTNLDLHIRDYVTVGFEGLADTIDALGGVDLDLTAEEAGYLNEYVEDMHYEIGTPDVRVEVADGLRHVTGIQAVAYCRIRYTAGDDYKRTERQRTVMKAVLSQARKSSPVRLLKAVRTFSDGIATSLSKPEMTALLLKAPLYSLDETSGLPAAELRTADMIQGQSCVIPLTLAENARWLHEHLYDEKGYRVSSALQQRSDYIQSVY